MRLIVTNGDNAIEKLRAAGVEADMLAWRDVLHDGPVPEEERLERLSQLRAAFIAREFGIPHDEVALSFAERDADIRSHRNYQRVEIWVEHDLYDQLQLLQILHFFASEGRRDGLFLLQAADYLGALDPDAIRALEPAALPVTEEQIALACAAWEAFTSPDPSAMMRVAAADTSALPFLHAALLRILAEFPDPVRGLSLTEERVLRSLDEAPATPGELFQVVSRQEDARFMGDVSFFRRIDGLAFVEEPLVDGLAEPFRMEPRKRNASFMRSKLRITPAGRRVLKGQLDHAMVNHVDRWIGGTRLRPALLLRYDRDAQELIAPL